MYNVHQPWDPLKVCAVGRSYPPEFYSWIKLPRVRSIFEQIATETEEDFQQLILVLKKHGVEIIRPQVPNDPGEVQFDGKFMPPPMQPRNHFVMIGSNLHQNVYWPWKQFYNNIKDPMWPDLEFDLLGKNIQQECMAHGYQDLSRRNAPWEQLIAHVSANATVTNEFKLSSIINGAMVSRIGCDLYFSTEQYSQDQNALSNKLKEKFPDYRCHVVNTGGHGDGVYCPVVPGLVISTEENINYSVTFPDWEVVRVPNTDWSTLKGWNLLKQKNQGKWWIPGFENDNDVIEVVETWLANWTGYVEESVFDVNMLVIDPKNVIVCQENTIVFEAFKRYGITPHVVPFRHRYFWDGGLHCMTCDFDRTGTITDYFPSRA